MSMNNHNTIFIFALALLLIPSLLYAGIILDEDEEPIPAVDFDSWEWYHYEMPTPGQETTREDTQHDRVDSLAIRLDVNFPSLYDPLGESPRITIKTRSPLITNCSFYIRTPDGKSYDSLSCQEDHELRQETMEGKSRIYEQNFITVIPQYYQGSDILFYVEAVNAVGRQASFGSGAGPIMIRVTGSKRALSIWAQVFFFFAVIIIGIFIIRKKTTGKSETPKKGRPSRRPPGRRPPPSAKPRKDIPPERDRLL